MGVRFLPDRSPFLGGATADTTGQWVAAVVANGGTVSSGRQTLVSSLINGLKTNGTWDLIDDAWMLVAENAPQARTSLKQRRLATEVAVPMFTIDRGYTFNGTTQYIDTGFIPGTHKVAMTGDSMHIAVYERTNLGQISVAAGCYSLSTSNLFIFPRRSDSVMAVQINAALGAGGSATVTDSRGLSVGSRNGTLITDVLAYKNGVAVVPQPATSVGSTLPTTKVFIGARSDNVNAPVGFRAATEGFVSVGAAIPAGQQPAFYNAIQTFMISLGAGTVDADVDAWVSQVVTNGGTVSLARTALVDSLVTNLKSAGTWALIDDAWLLVAENAAQALTSLKQRRLAVAVGTPTFTIDRGYAFGSPNYIDTGFIPSTHAVAMTGTSIHIAAYERTNIAASGFAAGAYNTSSQAILVSPRVAAGQMAIYLCSQSTGPGGDVSADSRGLSVGSRNGTLAADILAYRNGVAVLPFAPGALVSTLPTVKVFIGCRSDNVNAPQSFRGATQGFVSIGAAIPAGQQPAFYNAIQAHMAAVGANV